MAHPNEEVARGATEALAKGDFETFLSYQADDVVLHFPGRGPLAGDYRGKEGLTKLFQQQMQMLDGPPEIDTHDILGNDDHTIVLNNVKASRKGQVLEQRQVVVLHIEGGKVKETWLQFSEQQAMDEMASA